MSLTKAYSRRSKIVGHFDNACAEAYIVVEQAISSYSFRFSELSQPI